MPKLVKMDRKHVELKNIYDILDSWKLESEHVESYTLEELIGLRLQTKVGDIEEVYNQREVGDAELLMRMKVTIAEPETKVAIGEVYQVGRHLLVIADVVRDVSLWSPYLKEGILFLPYPGPLVALTLAGDSGPELLMVQPETYIAGHLLDQYKAVYGENEVSLVY